MIQQKLFQLVLLALPLLLCNSRAQDAAELAVDHALTFDYPTPHTAFAKPYFRGKTRVLFFCNGRGTVPRHCVELMQRFDLEAEAVFWARIVDSTKESWHGGDAGEKRMLKLLEKKWDCFVFYGFSPERMSTEAQVRLLKPVTQGAGLVLIGANDKRVLKPKNLLAPPPFLSDQEKNQYFKINAGRGAYLPKPADIPYAPGWEQKYDLEAEQVGRCILWAAGKEPNVLLDMQLTKEQKRELQLTIPTSLKGFPSAQLEVFYRRPGIPPVEFPARTITLPGTTSYELRLPESGTFQAVALLKLESGTILSWKAREFTLESARSVEKIELNQSWGEVGETIRGTAVLRGSVQPNDSFEIRLLDARRRILKTQQLKATTTTTSFAFTLEDWMPMLITVEAILLNEDREISRNFAYVNLCKRRRGKWNFLIWDVPKGTLAPYAEESLAKHGVTLQLGGGNPKNIVAANEISWVPYTTRIMAKQTPENVMKPFCWNDEASFATHIKAKTEKYSPSRGHGVFVWSLGDEVHTKGACAAPCCLEAYRRYLNEQYGSLKALNTSWGTEFNSWAEVGLSDPKDNDEAGSLRLGNYPRWYDRQAFKAWNFVQFCNKYRAAYEKLDPQAKVGFEGAGRFAHGDDIDLIIRNNTFWSPYPGTVDEIIRSLAPREFPRANWMGYTKDAHSLLGKYWRMVTRGMDSVWWWRWDCIGRFHGWLAPDLRPYPAVAEILEDTRIVREGLGDLLINSSMGDDNISILYSFPCTLAGKVGNGASFGGYENAHKGTHLMVRDLGLQFRYVTARMLRLGEFDADKCKVLFLPRAEAMSAKTAKVLEDFVAGGGLLIADVRPGIYDDHLKPRTTGALDPLFGIRRKEDLVAKVVEDPQFGQIKMDPAVEVTTGHATQTFGGVPAFITHKHGKGRTLLLNFDFSTFPKYSLPGTDEIFATDMLRLFRENGVAPAITLQNGKTGRTRGVETIRWQTGDIEIVSFFRTGGENQETSQAKLMDGKRIVYNLRTGACLGKCQSFPVELRSNRPSWFALLPQKAKSPKIKLPAGKTYSPGEIVAAEISVPKAAGLHALRLTVEYQGKTIDWRSDNLVTDDKAIAIKIPLALTDPEGLYTICVTDRYTGRTSEKRFSVRRAIDQAIPRH